jgi:colanic acid/amylovoran biosynthesis glycosyltransferase
MSGEETTSDSPRICYFYTTFPVVSETFLQRENRVIRSKTDQLEIHSIWGGKTQFENQQIHRFHLWELIKLFYWLPFWLIKKPAVLFWFAGNIIAHPPQYAKNWAETLLGFAFALIRTRSIADRNPELIHAVWATMPATAAIMVKKLAGIPFSMGAHAYDVFQKGGDCLLQAKLAESQFIHTSTKFAKKHLIQIGADPGKVHLIRRGLYVFPPMNELRETIDVIRFLTVGRLVEKKGLLEQLRIYRELRKRGIPFEVEIVGDGPIRRQLEERIRDYKLENQVKLIGKVDHDQIQNFYQRADFFIFTGVVAKSGDRNGLANVIPEAMSRGIPVLTTPDAGIVENFKPDQEAIILPIRPVDEWIKKILSLQGDYAARKSLGATARYWVERQFSARRNTTRLFRYMKKDCDDRRNSSSGAGAIGAF